MKHRKLLAASVGFLAVSTLVCVFALFVLLRHLRKESPNDAYPSWLYVAAWGLAVLAGLWWAIKGVQGLLLFASPLEEEKVRREAKFAQEVSRYRGGSRRTVIVLGSLAIVVWLGFSLWLRYAAP